MSAGYVAVQWSRSKVVYDLVVVLGIAIFIAGYYLLTMLTLEPARRPEPHVLTMRAFGTCAYFMLTAILMLGPLARIDRRFLPLLWNRRHFGVLFTCVAFWHLNQVLGWYHAYSSDGLSAWESLFTFDAAFTGSSVPFQLFGLAAFLIFLVMAATSHDFWQAFLGPRTWKSLHMAVYPAWALVVLHVAFGGLQVEHALAWQVVFITSVLAVIGVHCLAALRTARADHEDFPVITLEGTRWIDAGPAALIVPDQALGVQVRGGERIAVVRHADHISAVQGHCAHQGGPLSEGRMVDGCLTCPWHGWQYRPTDGRSPPPFEERIATHAVRLDERGHVLVAVHPDAPGTPQSPVRVPS